MPTGTLTFLQPFDLVTGLIGIDKVSAVGGQAVYASPTVRVTFTYDVADPTTATSFVIGNPAGSVTYATGDYPVSLFILNLALPGNTSLALAAMLTNLGTMALGPTADVDLSTYVYPGLTLQGNDLGTKFSVSAAATVNAGAGNDEIVLGDAPEGVIDGGAGTDTLASGGAGTLEVIVSGDPLNAPDQILIWQGPDFVGAWNVTGVEVYRGSGGDDRFSGAGIGTQFVGGAGSDNFFFSGGEMFADSVDYGQETGGKGVAVNLDWTFNVATADAELAAALDALVDGDIPPDTIWINDTYGFNDNAQLGMTIIGTSFADAFNGSAEADVFRAAGGADLIFGGAGEDTLYGGDGNDTINGGEGNDDIDAGEGDDTIVGGTGDNRIEGGAGNDVLRYAGNQDEYSINYTAGVFTIEGDDGTDTVTGVETFMFGDGPVDASSYVQSNSAPTAADKTITIAEDGSHTFAATDFGFSDVDAGDTLQSIRITSLPTSGTLKLDGVAVGADDVIAAADIAMLVFAPSPDANGAPLASFGFKVSDGTLESETRVVTINVTPVNDAPTNADKAITIAEDGSYTFAAADFGFSDVDAGDTLQAVRITSLPTCGTLKLGGVAVEAGDVVAAADIPTLVFAPSPDANGAPLASFGFKVSDGTLESDSKTITINVTAVNDAPSGTDKTVTVAEDGSHTFAATDFGFSDVDAGDTLHSIRITSLPTGGTLKLDGLGVLADQSIAAASVPLLVFVPDANLNGSPLSTFGFKVSDGTLESEAKVVTINVTPVNDAPTSVDNAISLMEDFGYAFGSGDFAFNDVDGEDTLQSVRIVSLPTSGTLTFDGMAVSAGQVIDHDIWLLSFAPTANAEGWPLTSFQFTVSDGALESSAKTFSIYVYAQNDAPTANADELSGTEDTPITISAGELLGNDTDPDAGAILIVDSVTNGTGGAVVRNHDGSVTFTPTANFNGVATFTYKAGDWYSRSSSTTVTINVAAVADAPTTGDQTITIGEDGSYTFSVADFAFAGADVGETLHSIRITSLPTGGTLKLDGIAVEADDVIDVGDIPTLVFVPGGTAGGTSTSFGFKVSDGALESDAKTITFNVADANEAPSATDNTITLTEDGSYTFGEDDFGFTDADAGDTLQSVRITSLPTGGTLTLGGVAVEADDVIAVAVIPTLVFAPNTNANGAPLASFGFKVSDGELESDTKTITLDVTASNDAALCIKRTKHRRSRTPVLGRYWRYERTADLIHTPHQGRRARGLHPYWRGADKAGPRRPGGGAGGDRALRDAQPLTARPAHVQRQAAVQAW